MTIPDVGLTGSGDNVLRPGTKPKDTPEKILDAARQFEGLLIAQMLKGVQDEDSDGLGGEDGAAGSLIGGIGQQQFALALSKQGGLGLAKTIAEGLSQRS